MQFVAASKLKRAQDSTLSARPYSDKIDEVLADLAAVLGGEDHPLLAKRESATYFAATQLPEIVVVAKRVATLVAKDQDKQHAATPAIHAGF